MVVPKNKKKSYLVVVEGEGLGDEAIEDSFFSGVRFAHPYDDGHAEDLDCLGKVREGECIPFLQALIHLSISIQILLNEFFSKKRGRSEDTHAGRSRW